MPVRAPQKARERTRILIVDRYPVYRLGIASLLGQEPNFDLVGEADDSRSAVERAAEMRPDVVLIDISLPPPGGIETARLINQILPAAGIVVLAPSPDEDALIDAIKAGAAAFVPKTVGLDDLVTIIRRVVAGEDLMSAELARPAVASRIIQELRRGVTYEVDATVGSSPLTRREAEILNLAGRFMTNQQIAGSLSISDQTVKNHMSVLFRKLSVRNRTEAVLYAMRQGWIAIEVDG